MSSFQIACLTPPGLPDPSLAIAASRAGELGILNLELVADIARARGALGELAARAHRPTGVRFGVAPPAFVAAVLEGLPESVRVVLLDGREEPLADWVRRLKEGGRSVWLEATSAAEAVRARELGADGVVAKGHEAGGWVGEETTLVLVQRILKECALPVLAQGGIGLHTAAACAAAGAAGVVLDSQLGLLRESPLPPQVRAVLAGLDGSETVCLGAEPGRRFRIFNRPKLPAAVRLAEAVAREGPAWRRLAAESVDWDDADAAWPLGQDAAFAAKLADEHPTVAALTAAMRRAVEGHVAGAAALQPLDAGAPLALSHGTRYPIVQGPMTRVSDTAEFAWHVAEAGALPFLALALMKAEEAEALLRRTAERLGDRPWGVGILGFVPLDLRQEQLEVIRRHRPGFVLIAGGRPDQARQLESEGITTYLHVPSPGLLRLFLGNGARRFVFEGRECGGHVGPRTSFVLWDSMIDILLAEVPEAEASSCHVLFAGGIHDAVSAAMVAAMAAPLAARGIRVGVLIGTAYLFTREAIEGGAILPEFQRRALDCQGTVLVETGPGHAIRCVPNAFTFELEAIKRRMADEGTSAEETRTRLEELNIGRLRLASKGVKRGPGGGGPRLVAAGDEEQWREGMYMIGQVAALRRQVVSIADLHADIAAGGTERIARSAAVPRVSPAPPTPRPSRVAIVGMSALLPRAPSLQAFWANVLAEVYAIEEIPKDRWDWETYFDADRTAKDKIYSRWGGFLADVPFDPLEFGMPPSSLASIDPMQLLALVAARTALHDAGYAKRRFDRARTAVILGASGGSGELGTLYNLRSGLPLIFGDSAGDVIARMSGLLPEWTEDSFAGLLPNVTAGRIANRLDLGGVNYAVDAACASSLAAVHLAVTELETGGADMVIVGGVDTVQTPFGYLCFSKTQALSPTGQPRTFDAEADGIAISEGVVMLVLKRLDDAERDGDRVYAVIQGTAGSSDGRAKGLTAPRPEGQIVALERAYAKAGISPTTVGLFEAHGTGTVVGDRTEAVSLATFLERHGATPARHAVGSVKSMIGHTKATAGVAGLAKVALALHHRVLPATLGVTVPNPKAGFGDGPLYVNSKTRPWIQPEPRPRRAGVSAFGFGGTNFHAVVEEYTGGFLPGRAVSAAPQTELFLFTAASPAELAAQLEALQASLSGGARPAPHDLAYTLAVEYEARPKPGGVTAAVVAGSLHELEERLASLRTAIGGAALHDEAKGIFWSEPRPEPGGVALLFPGQGSQEPDMLRQLALLFPEVRGAFERADRTLSGRFPGWLSDVVFPPPAFRPEDEREQQRALAQTNVAQPALGAASVGVLRLLEGLGVRADAYAGHSYGELVALHAAGVLDEASLFALSEARGRSILEAAEQGLGGMAAVSAGAEQVAEALGDRADVWIANRNAPRQTAISGTEEGLSWALERLRELGLAARRIPVSCAFHSPLVAPARARLAGVLAGTVFASPRVAVYSNTTAARYPDEPDAIRALLAEHLVQPVRFVEELEALYRAGIRTFVEAGPRNVLTALVRQTLGDRPHLAIAVDHPGRSGVTQLQNVLARLASQGLRLRPTHLFQAREARLLSLPRLVEETRERPLAGSVWLVNGGRARPASQPLTRPASLEWKPDGATTKAAGAAGGASPAGDAAVTVAPPPTSTVSTGLASPGADREGSEQVMLQFQGLMSQFLDTQKQVMTAFLSGSRAASVAQEAKPSGLSRPAVDRGASRSVVAPPPAVPIEPAASQAEAPPEPVAVGRGEVARRLVQIVSERTGYPPDMLKLEADLEAELGIDSIKRVEILGALQRSVLAGEDALGPEMMEQLTAVKTLGGIVDWITDALARAGLSRTPAPAPAAAKAADAAVPEATAATLATKSEALPCVEWVPVERELEGRERETLLEAGRVVVITDDGRGAAEALALELGRRGLTAVVVGRAAAASEIAPGRFEADVTTLEGARDLFSLLSRTVGRPGALVHLLPLSRDPGEGQGSLAEWRARIREEVKSLFCLLKAGAPDLAGGFVVAACNMGGGWGAPGARFFPAHGALAGMLKTAAQEWPATRCKALDFDPSMLPAEIASSIGREIASTGSEVQAGYRSGRRVVLVTHPIVSDASVSEAPPLTPESVVLITGGARGITAEVAIHLAERWRPRLVLAGRSAEPGTEEDATTAGLRTAPELKAALIARERAAGRDVVVADIEAACGRVLREREIRLNLARLRRTATSVEYRQADVGDEGALAGLLSAIHQSYGRLDGVIHGAGLIEDKRITDKTPESFDRVFDTKADSGFLLGRLLSPETLKFAVLFSSAAASYGNPGQVDYAAANEVLNKLATQWSARWPGRAVAIGWGPWQGSGMVNPALESQFARRGIQLITPPAGCELIDRELERGSKGPAAIVAGAWTRTDFPQPLPEAEPPRSLPLLAGATRRHDAGVLTVTRTFDPERDRFLPDHQLDGVPAFPLAMAAELAAEVAQSGWPDLRLAGIRGLERMKGILFGRGPETVRVTARALDPTPDSPDGGVDVAVEMADAADPSVRAYRAVVEMAPALPSPPALALLPLPAASLDPFAMSVAEAYRQWLFHGPLFQGITEVVGISRRGVVARIRPSRPGALVDASGAWLVDPVVLDSGLQLLILWIRQHHDMTPLPARFDRYRRFGSLDVPEVLCQAEILDDLHGRVVQARLSFFDGRRLLGVMEGLEVNASKELNRLTSGGPLARAQGGR